MSNYDAIVLGVGGMGSAALYHLARRGLRVLGIEQFDIAHDRGSSHGQSRIIRKAYFEHSDYVPLLFETYRLWSELETAAERTLMHRTGLIIFGRPEGAVLSGVRRSAEVHGLAIERLSAPEARRRYPQFLPITDGEAILEPDAGYLDVEDCVRAHAALARRHGAEIASGRAVRGWAVEGRNLVVETADTRYAAERLVICAGAWSGRMLAAAGLPLEVRRKPVFWYRSQSDVYDVRRGCPVFAFDLPQGFFYGFPALSEREVKIAEHSGGEPVADPESVDRTLLPADTERISAFLSQHLADLSPAPVRHSVCLYTMTPDEHFIIDRLSEHPNVVYAAGFSGHGFKFAPVVGAALADLAIDGTTRLPIGFLSLGRQALAGR